MKDDLLQKLWSKAVGTPGYEKAEWLALERELAGLKTALREACELVQAAVKKGDIHDWYERGEPSPADRRFELSRLAK